MKLERRLQLTLKAVNRELKQYLKAFEPSHPYYKRNIRNLYEGLNELGILDDIQTTHSFKEFERAFQKTDKGLKQALILAHVFEDSSLSTYFKHKGQPLNRIKLLGNIFIAKQAHPSLNEQKYAEYSSKLYEKQMMAQDKKDLAEIKEGLKQFKKKIKLEDKKSSEIWKAIDKYVAAAKAIEETWGIGVEFTFKKKEKIEADGYFTETGYIVEKAVDADKYLAQLEDVIDEYDNNIDEISEKLEYQYQQKIKDLKKYETLQEEAISQVKLKQDLELSALNSVKARLKILQSSVQDKTTVVKEQTIPNVVKPFTDVINLRRQLYVFIQFLDSKRMSLREPWRVAEFRSGGSGGRNRAISKMAVEIGINPQDAEITMGNSRESFHKRDLRWIVKEVEKYEFFFRQYLELVPQSQLRSSLTDLLYDIASLNNYLLTDFEEEAFVERNILGQIINYESHTLVNQAHKEILGAFAKCILQSKQCIAECDKFIEYNEKLIEEAKGDRTTLRKQLTKLITAENNIDKIMARRQLRMKELEGKVKEKEKDKKDDNGLIDGLYALE